MPLKPIKVREMKDTIENYAIWLKEANGDVLDKEAQAEACLAQPDYAGAYKDLMFEKAELIRRLPDEFQQEFPGKEPASRAMWERVVSRLRDFAAGAENALSIGSPFYMSALLYPDEHQPGDPNNLELLIAELRGK